MKDREPTLKCTCVQARVGCFLCSVFFLSKFGTLNMYGVPHTKKIILSMWNLMDVRARDVYINEASKEKWLCHDLSCVRA